MNTDQDLKNPSTTSSSDYRCGRQWPFIYLLLFLTAAVLWSYCCGGCLKDTPGGGGSGVDGNNIGSNKGTGTGSAGKKSGTGSSGSGQGAKEQAPPAPAPGTRDKSTQVKSDGSPNTPSASKSDKKGSASGKVIPPVDQVEYFISPGKKAASGHGSSNSSVTSRKGFYGIDTSGSTRSIFIVDVSTSMGATSLELPGKSRMDVLKIELIKSIFNPGRKHIGGFVILAFNGTTVRFPADEKLCRYRKTESMKKARDFIEKMNPSGGTSMCQVWQIAIKIAADEKIDTIYFMTDGSPGDAFDDQWLLPKLQNNGLNKVKIHCISIGRDQPFMARIAQAAHGQYIYIP